MASSAASFSVKTQKKSPAYYFPRKERKEAVNKAKKYILQGAFRFQDQIGRKYRDQIFEFIYSKVP